MGRCVGMCLCKFEVDAHIFQKNKISLCVFIWIIVLNIVDASGKKTKTKYMVGLGL